MRNLWIGAGIGLLLAGSAASAQVTGVVTGGGTKVTLKSGVTNRTGQNYASQLAEGVGYNAYANYQVSANLTPNDIVFGNNVTAEGRFSSVTASTQITITFKNDGSSAVTPKLQSTIVPGGFGFYVAAPGGNVTQSGRNGSIADINQTPQNTGAGFDSFGVTEGGSALAGASFSLDIKSAGTTIKSLSGAVSITPGTSQPEVNLALGGDTGTVLNNFRLLTTPGSLNAVGYQWDTTDLLFDIPGGPLAPGDSRTLTYDTQVTAYTYAVYTTGMCGDFSTCPTAQAYSGFGDPIGRGTGGSAGTISGLSRRPQGAPGVIGGLTFNRFAVGLPMFDSTTGILSVSSNPMPLPSLPLTPAPIPEPGAWVLLLSGLGWIGFALRRRPDLLRAPDASR